MKVVGAEQMRAIEASAVANGVSLDWVMQRAGGAVAAAVTEFGAPCLILAGPGNNGEDGLIAARRLRANGSAVTVYTFGRAKISDEMPTVLAEDDTGQEVLARLVHESAVVVDALLGTGQNRAPEGLLAAMIETVNLARGRATAIAVDIPTGVNADTGSVPGVAFEADLTICMQLPKLGDVLYPGAGYAGALRVADIKLPIPENLAGNVTVPDGSDIAALLPKRGMNSNKGSFGRVVFCGGSRDFLGAPALSSLAAYRSGAGLVELAVIEQVQRSVAAHAMEVVYQLLPEDNGSIGLQATPVIVNALSKASALVFGPGMSLSDNTIRLTREVLRSLPEQNLRGTVIDADGLNALSRIPDWWNIRAPIVLTPHPGEMSRLTGLSIDTIQSDRLEVARSHARKWGTIVVLKGAGTVVAAPDGRASINPTGGPNLATAGTGDVLSGIIGGLLAQGCEPFEAAIAGTFLHGRAGDIVRERLGDAGTVASDLLPAIPVARRAILQEGESRK